MSPHPTNNTRSSNLDTVGHQEQDVVELPECMTEIVQDFAWDETTGPEIPNGKLVSLLSDMLSKRLSEDKFKAKLDKYPRPSNMEYLQCPKVNNEIWRKLDTDTKNRDIRMQKAQGRIVKGLTPLAMVLHSLSKLRKNPSSLTQQECDELIKTLMDSFILLGSASQEVSHRRRELIKPDMNWQYQSLCSVQNPVTTQLFGDDLSKAMREINETNRVAYRVSGPKGQSKYSNKGKQPARPGRYQYRGHGDRYQDRYHPYSGPGEHSTYQGQSWTQRPRGKPHMRPKNAKKGPQERR